MVFYGDTFARPEGDLLVERDGKVHHPSRRRVDVPCEAFDLTPPPHRLDLMFLQGGPPWTWLVHSPTGRLLEVRRWLERAAPDRVQMGDGLDPRVLRAEFAGIPESWGALLNDGPVRFMHLSAAGMATLFLESGEGPGRWIQVAKQADPDARQALPGPPSPGLTPRQFEAVSLAVSMGYYEVPHRVNQRDLAERLGMSLSGMSRLLRRAEASIIRAHMDKAVDVAADNGRFDALLGPEETRRARVAMLAMTAAAIR